jgi:hypothetical protein
VRVLAVATCAAIAAIAPSAAAAPAKSVPIRIGHGIGPVNIGMTGVQVSRALGRPRAVIERRVVGGRPYVELEYGFGNWNIGLLGRKGQRRVVLVGTALGRHKTPEGVGVGTTERIFWRRMRGQGFRPRNCAMRRITPDHWVLRRGGTETVFFPHYPYRGVGQQGPVAVVGVEVRAMPTLGCAF